MCADPLSEMRLISLMIVELAVDNISTQPKRVLLATHVNTLLPEPAME
jgi:hypothetical protein